MRINYHRINSSVYKLKYILDYVFGGICSNSKFKTKKRKIVFCGTPEHDNLGDHAIALSIDEFIKKTFKDYEVIEITIKNFYRNMIPIRRYIKCEDIFIYTGGGNMGDLYITEERQRRWISKNFPKNIFVIMPQTIYYSNEKEIKRSKDIMDKETTIISAREKISFEFAEKYFEKAHILLAPDMVFRFYNLYNNICIDKKCIGLCMRNDVERADNILSSEVIEQKCSKYDKVKHFNTCASGGIEPSNRENAVKNILLEISKYKLVVTDRLHAMIFSYITRTPCIVFNSYNHKIISSHEWIKDCGYVALVNSEKEFDEVLEKFIKEDVIYKKNDNLDLEYKKFQNKILSIISKGEYE